MIPHWLPTLAAFATASFFFTLLGLPLARATAPRFIPPLSLAPILGWATYTTLSLPLLTQTSFGPWQITLFAAIALTAAYLPLPLAGEGRNGAVQNRLPYYYLPLPLAGEGRGPRRRRGKGEGTPGLPLWALPLATSAAWLPATAIMPKRVPTGILLAPPMFDHVKIAVVDAILRTGLPIPNPFYGPDNPGHLAYYYLWHFSAATLAEALQCGGWAAEAAMTGFIAFAALMLMLGLATSFGARSLGLLAVPLLCLPGSARPALAALVGPARLEQFIPRGSDLAGWLNQAAWVPQHMAAATCALLAALLIIQLAHRPTALTTIYLGLSVAAAFESSIWIGGLAFAPAATALTLYLLTPKNLPLPPFAGEGRGPSQSDGKGEGPLRPKHPAANTSPPPLRGGTGWGPAAPKIHFLTHALTAAALTTLLILPLLQLERHAAQARGPDRLLALLPYPVFTHPQAGVAGAILNLLGFWPLLAFSWPATLPLALIGAWRTRTPTQPQILTPLAITAAGFLATAWLLRSTIDNNDLGWRAVLPPLLLITPLAACALQHLATPKSWRTLAICLALAALGVPDSIRMLREYAAGQQPGNPAGFVQSQPLWQAIRRLSAPQDRIAINPDYVGGATPWPVNIAWATLSDRPSCYAGYGTVLAYAPMPRATLNALNNRIARLFAGTPTQTDLTTLATQDNCALIILTPQDAAWQTPNLTLPPYQLADTTKNWKIYRRQPPATPSN